MTTPDERRPPDIQHFNELDERAPLIPNTSPIEQHDQLHKPSQDLVKDTPLPKSKIFLLSLARCASIRRVQVGRVTLVADQVAVVIQVCRTAGILHSVPLRQSVSQVVIAEVELQLNLTAAG